ncbi:hypothetical protein [Dyella subtropica]|uniref:hypothetical protein n=1 Tax=Dyella subtropica TaxID=2992127 RepID=UPI00225A40C8|nr:hypothetical protein [Dyella subtropica]
MRTALLLSLSVLSVTLAAATSPTLPFQVSINGSIRTSAGEQPATLTVICAEGKGGALSLQLRLPGTQLTDYDLDAYEGPGAPAAQKPSAHLQIGNLHPVAKVGGWYTNDQADGPLLFVFGIASMSGQSGTAAMVVRALGRTAASLRWTQDNPQPRGQPLIASFSPTPEESAQIARISAPCLPAAKRR